MSSKKYNIGVSSEAKYAVKPKKRSQGGLSGAIIFTPDQLDFLETLKGSSKRQGEQLLRYNPQKHPLGAAPVLQPTSGPSWQSCGFNQLHGAEPGVSPLQGPVINLQKFTEEDLLVFCNTHRLHLWTRLAELRVSINFKERNLGFRSCKDQQVACNNLQKDTYWDCTSTTDKTSGPRWLRSGN